MVVFQAIAWEGTDVDEEDYTITVYGRTADGKSVSVSTPFQPYFYIKVPPKTAVSTVWEALSKLDEPIEYDVHQMKDLWGFTNNQLYPFMRIKCKTLACMRRVAARAKFRKANGYTLKIYESNIDPVLRFMHMTGIQSTGWLEAVGDRAYITTCDIDLFCGDWKTMRPVENDAIAPFRISSFDIECYSSTGKFPDADVRDDTLFQIAFTTKTYGSDDPPVQKCFCVKRTNADNCESFETERDLLIAVKDYITKLDPDILTGWNIFGFDLEYIYKRMVHAKCDPDTFCLGRRRESPCILVEKNLSSSALGQNILKMLPMSGRYTFDLFQTIKAEHKLESYSLNNVSLEFLGDRKNDMPIREMFTMYANGNPDDLGRIAEYCIKDTELPIRLMEKLYTVENLIEMAKATWVPLSFLSERGQQIKVFSQIAKKARELRFAIPVLQRSDEPSEYVGATVLDAQTGAYYQPITALDFASLYPSIMMAHNLCYSTLVMDPRYDNLPGVEYETHGAHRFAQNVPSLLPAILSDLKQFRKKAKADMAKAKGTPMYHVYNGKQLAYKISMNSVYGFTGASKGMLPCVAIASTVTSQGRTMIQMSKDYVEQHYPGSIVRYGDSVMPGTPVIVRKNGIISIETIENLGYSWNEYPGFLKDGTNKEQSELNDIEAWTHAGWKTINRVIRHKCTKKIWRVLTHTGLVDVTEDHSLLDPKLQLVKPKDVTVGDQLFHSFPDTEQSIDASNLFVYGMFVGDGSCGEYDCPSGKKYSWAINNSDYQLLEKCKNLLEHMYPTLQFVIMDTVESSGVYKLSPRGKIKDFVKQWRVDCYDGQSKKVPHFALGNPTFLEGLWASDGCRRDFQHIGCTRIDTKNQITAQWYYIYLRSLGYNVSINTRSDKPNVFRLTFTKSPQRKSLSSVKKIQVLHDAWDGYVYDLETEAGTFQAGVGQLIVKNTDSIMVQFDTGGRTGIEAIEYSWKLGERAADEITKIFKRPNELELEKVYCPYFLYSKKRYAAKMWVMGKSGKVEFDKIDIKGLQVIRRDNCAFVREACQDVIDMILESSDPSGPLEYAERKKADLLSGRVPMEKLVLSKRLGDSYKNNNLAHVVVRDKIRERAPGSEPQSGDRVQFVIVDTGNKKHKMYEKAEDPAFVASNDLPLDYVYYLKHQFENPVKDLLEPLLSNSITS